MLTDTRIRALSDRIRLVPWASSAPPSAIATVTTVNTRDSRVLQAMVTDFKGTPDNPPNREELRQKFLMLTRHCGQAAMSSFFERLQGIEHEQLLEWISV